MTERDMKEQDMTGPDAHAQDLGAQDSSSQGAGAQDPGEHDPGRQGTMGAHALRPATLEDAEALAELATLLAVVDDTDEKQTVEDLLEEWETPGLERERDIRVVEVEGTLIGWVTVYLSGAPRDGEIRVHVSGGVHPEYRKRGVGTALVTWGMFHGRGLAQEKFPESTPALEAWGREEDSDSAELLSNLGFEAARWFTDMRVVLDEWSDPSGRTEDDPRGRIPAFSGSNNDSEAVRLAHNEAFRDHWGSSESTRERWESFRSRRVNRSELSRIAVDPALDPLDAVDAYILSEEWEPGELYIALVGTRRRARGRHLATELLADVVRAAKRAGMDRVDLGVDAASPTGANGVYERVGFKPVRIGVSMKRY